jgi:3-deoxy-D-manno-octulosonate 8-phosphate phosphatase (KDO 8-P phosphatase)
VGSSPVPTELERLLAATRLLALDVDGTLTDGRVVYGANEELVRFDVHDGQGLVWLREAGVTLAWISGRGCAAVERRARDLGVPEVHLRVGDKEHVLAAIQERLGVVPGETAAMGDDLPDLALARRAGLFVAPANARPEVRARAGLVTAASGGRGAVRELAEALLRARGLWQARLEHATGRAPESAE